MQIATTDKKAEAIARMQILGISSETIRQFAENDYVRISKPPIGKFFEVEDADLQRIREFEEQHDALVYLVIRSYTGIGMMDSYLFVSDYDNEWEIERANLENGASICYVYNHDAPHCSECGYVGVEKTSLAGLRRTW